MHPIISSPMVPWSSLPGFAWTVPFSAAPMSNLPIGNNFSTMKSISFHKWMTTFPLFCLVSMVTSAQKEIIQDLPARFQDYQLPVFQEKVYAHIDKTFYIAGEIIWFKIY